MRDALRRIKTLLHVAASKEFLVRLDVVCRKETLGSAYGGWDIVTDGLNAQSVVYSFGVGEDASFDMALIDRFGLTVHAFDPTPKSIEWVKRQGFSNRFVLHEYGIAAFNGTVAFNPPENPAFVSYTLLERPSTAARAIQVPIRRLSTIMEELGHDRIDLLKMDIEGAEYDVIEDIERSGVRPRQILVEFHHRFPGVGIEKSKEAIARLRTMGYQLFSVSVTNEEFSFIRDFNC